MLSILLADDEGMTSEPPLAFRIEHGLASDKLNQILDAAHQVSGAPGHQYC
jgi:hypothetical protein